MPRDDVPGVANFAQVSPQLYRGAQPTASGMAELKKMGIRTIVNLRALHSDRDELSGTGLRYVHIRCNAWHPEQEDVTRFLKVVQNRDNWPVFVHCQQGADRTGMMVAVYRMVEQGWSADDAMAELPRFGFHPIWTEIREYLNAFDPQRTKSQVDAADAPTVEVVP
jgi:protein tyrosine/serine phosphatase